MEPERLAHILTAHSQWLADKTQGCQANLRGATLWGATLGGANLRTADLRSADLRSADLRGANLGGANLWDANLWGATLCGADLRSADLRSADLRSADLRGANLSGADLRSADLRDANLRDGDLGSANLGGANLPTGETFETYIAQVVPALCAAGGRTLAEVAAHWDCHTWDNCPMAYAFGVTNLEDIPLLYQPRVEQFMQLFDAGLLPCPEA